MTAALIVSTGVQNFIVNPLDEGERMPLFDWNTCSDPTMMLKRVRDHASDRKIRFYLCARARQVASLLKDHRSLQVIDVAEQYADGRVTRNQLSNAHTAACEAAQALTGLPEMNDRQIDEASAAWTAALCAGEEIRDDWTISRDTVLIQPLVLCNLLRDICFLSFSHADDRTWLQTLSQEIRVREMALQIYETQDFGQMPVLGVLLEKHGCESTEALLHCRRSEIHAKGCWLIDSLLGLS